MKKRIHVNGYANNYRGRRPRVPFVHITGFDHENAEISSFTFDPNDALKVCGQILKAAKAARAGRNYEGKLIPFKEVPLD